MPAPGMDNLSWPTLDDDFSMEQLQQFSWFLPQHSSYRAPKKDSAKTWANLVRTQLGHYHAEQTRPEFGTDRCGACNGRMPWRRPGVPHVHDCANPHCKKPLHGAAYQGCSVVQKNDALYCSLACAGEEGRSRRARHRWIIIYASQ